eukprot:GHVT01015642.1.p1 GENE.GHVT01015642.1~~GHVT01015642.1.p1  ORF type:complete len:146 (+),score=2.26 GHVT01015642.1:165-602(+)
MTPSTVSSLPTKVDPLTAREMIKNSPLYSVWNYGTRFDPLENAQHMVHTGKMAIVMLRHLRDHLRTPPNEDIQVDTNFADMPVEAAFPNFEPKLVARVFSHYLPVYYWLRQNCESRLLDEKSAYVIGISAIQGFGKTTLTGALQV